MKDFITAISAIVLLIAVVLCTVFGICALNNYWNCSSYKEAQTKMIGGTCYVKTEKGKWILFHSYVSQLNVKEE